MGSKLLSTNATAEKLGVSVFTVRRLVKSGALPGYRVGGEFRIDEADADRYLDGCRVKAQARDLVHRTTAAQGLPTVVDDQDTLNAVAKVIAETAKKAC